MLAELGRRGYAVFEEAGRRVVRRELASGGDGVPWRDMLRFTALTIAEALATYAEAVRAPPPAFLDRSVVEQACWLKRTGRPVPVHVAAFLARRPFHPFVFFAPPWPEIFEADSERRHDLAAALEEYAALLPAYEALGYEIVLLPKTPVQARVDFVITRLGVH